MPQSLTRRLASLLLVLTPLAGTQGCLYTRAQTDTKRTATEQLLLTESMERVVTDLELSELRGRSLALEVVSLADEDAAYLQALLEARLREDGVELSPADEAELILQCFVGGLGTVSRGLAFGIPPLPLGGIVTPGLPLVRFLKQRGYTKLRVVARDREGHHLEKWEPVMRRAYFDIYSFLFFAIRRNDIYPGEGFQVGVD